MLLMNENYLKNWSKLIIEIYDWNAVKTIVNIRFSTSGGGEQSANDYIIDSISYCITDYIINYKNNNIVNYIIDYIINYITKYIINKIINCIIK